MSAMQPLRPAGSEAASLVSSKTAPGNPALPSPARNAGPMLGGAPQQAPPVDPAATAAQPVPPVRDVGLRLKGMQRMEVRGRRKHRVADSSNASSVSATEGEPSEKKMRTDELPADLTTESELHRWLKVAPAAAHKTFSTGPEAVLRRLSRQPAQKIKGVLQSCSRRRAQGDRDVDVLTWMEGFLVAILAKDFGVHVRMTLEGPVDAVAPARDDPDDSVELISESYAPCPSKQGQAAAMPSKPARLLRAPSWGNGAAPRQTLRISAGRAASAAGIHPFTDMGEFFLEMVYQDLPELLLKDSALVEVEIVSKQDERERLLEKSGEVTVLEEILRQGAKSVGLEGIRAARDAVGKAIANSVKAQRLTADESAELRNTLEMELNLGFGMLHEDAAIAAYEARVGMPVYGDQYRIQVAMPCGGPQEALAQSFPPTGTGNKQNIDAKAAAAAAKRAATKAAGNVENVEEDRPYFLLTGFTDGIVDVPKNASAPSRCRPSPEQQKQRLTSAPAYTGQLETLVVEVKHRMGKIQDPPNIYDVVQLCCYCRVLGCARGDLVQCLRDGPGLDAGVGELHVTRIDFTEGSADRDGFDKHVLPAMYEVARAVYAVRDDEMARLRLLAATPEERLNLIGCLCPHLQK